MRKPELIDLHFNGLKNEVEAINCNFWKCPNDAEILKLRKYLFKHGVKAFLPTLVTDSAEAIEKQLSRISDHIENYGNKEGHADIAGVHIEGGYISRPGTHPKEFCQALGPDVVEKLAEKFPELIKLWTICPKVDADGKHVAAQRKYGIIPSYGHSIANYEEAMKGFNEHGVRLVTHWGNGMDIFIPDPSTMQTDGQPTPYNRNEPSKLELERLDSKDCTLGALGKAAYDHPGVYMMVICGDDSTNDRHISPKLVKKVIETGRGILVTDAVAQAAGPASVTGCSRGYALCGGQVTLDKHAENARKAGLTEEQIQQATVTNPGKVLANAI